jgi:hypothetical protein
MSKSSDAVKQLPNAASKALLTLGTDLAIARQRRKESLKNWALRVGVSIPTLMRMEKGDPSVSMGVYATALWLIGRQKALAEVANPKEDLGALEIEIKKATSRHSPSHKVSA